jgi:hypothetical protein
MRSLCFLSVFPPITLESLSNGARSERRSRQRLGEHVPALTNIHETLERLLNAVLFYAVRVLSNTQYVSERKVGK